MKKLTLLFIVIANLYSAQFENTRLVNSAGTIRNTTHTDFLDKYGSPKSSLNFEDCSVVDRHGTLGCHYSGPGLGYQNNDATITNTHNQTWTTNRQTLPLSLPVPSGNNVLLGCIAGTEIIATGSLVTTGHLIIAGTSRNINTITSTQKGGGTVTLVDSQTLGVNGVTNIIVDEAATLKLGTDWTKVHGWFYGTGASGQLSNNGTVEVRSESYKNFEVQVGGNTTSTGIIRFIGKPDGTSFYDTYNINTDYGTNIISNGLVEIENAVLRFRRIASGVGGSGIVRVKAGASLITQDGDGGTTANQKIYISGNGSNATGYPKVAFGLERYKNLYVTQPMELEASATIAYANIYEGNAYGFFPPIVSTVARTLTIGCPAVGTSYGTIGCVNFQSANPNLLGPVVVDYGTLRLGVASAISNAQSLTVNSNGKIQPAVANTVKDLIFEQNGALVYSATLTAATLSAPNGFKVDIPAGTAAGTYTILTVNAGSAILPTVGVNSSGRTASFAWSGNNLIMTLS